MATQQEVEAVKAQHGEALRSRPGVFALSPQRGDDDGFALVVFVDRAFPLPANLTIGTVDIVFRHEERLRP